jgi:glycosyltransferase involved in cell wall biosynthesis
MSVVSWQEIENLFNGMAQARPHMRSRRDVDPSPPLMHSPVGRLRLLRAAARKLPPELRQPLGEAVRAQIAAARSLTRTIRAIPAALTARRRAEAETADASYRIPGASRQPVIALRDVAQPGDVFASFGAPWTVPDYALIVERMRHELGLRYAALIHDLIPVIRPEYSDRAVVGMFTRCIHGCLPQADAIFAVSESTARDIGTWEANQGISLRTRPRASPVGTGFTHAVQAPVLPAGLAPGGYALFVSTIEARKNHVLAFRAWRRLLQELPPEQVPTLVFAGRIGWMVDDLMRQIENAGHMNGKLAIIQNPDDATLAALYAGARFTLFPSLYEGWGLPVSESLSFGKVCLASSAAAVPEAGGEFCLYHDPDSVTEATALYRRAITEPGLIEALEARIRREYTPVSWSSTAHAVLEALH